ncbi:hypothetical protein B0H13DRAFT_1061764 [Mycena leptocephala]|nr:hypothetical protein B0H13DRAFT_1061764 [Mycena leptocephala]
MSHSASNDSSTDAKKRYACKECDKAFSTSSHLGRHCRVHTGVKDYKCDFPGCETRCSRPDNLQAHKRVHFSSQPRTKGKKPRGKHSTASSDSHPSPGSSTSSSSPTDHAHQPSSPEMYRTPASRFSSVSASSSPQPFMSHRFHRSGVEPPAVPRSRCMLKIDSTTSPSHLRRHLIRGRECLVCACRTPPDLPILCRPPSSAVPQTSHLTRLIPACYSKTYRRCKDAATYINLTLPRLPGRPHHRNTHTLHTLIRLPSPASSTLHPALHHLMLHRPEHRIPRLQSFPIFNNSRPTRSAPKIQNRM